MLRSFLVLFFAMAFCPARSQDAMHYRNFALRDTLGTTYQLKDYVDANRYVLVEFWASWCAPCRSVYRSLGANYDRWRSRGLEVVSVSLDTRNDDWIGALRSQNAPWVHLSDLRGWRSVAIREYGVEYIPYCVLVGHDGAVVARGAYDDGFVSKIESVLLRE